MNRIFEISDIERLREYLLEKSDRESLREQLYGRLLKYSRYQNVTEWNMAVRLCESLAIIGWGIHRPVEAIRGKWFNGNPETYFRDRYGKIHYLDAVWSKRKDGYAIDYGRSFDYSDTDATSHEPIQLADFIGEVQDMPIATQRNWIAKNPIRIIRGLANCYKNSKPMIESLETRLVPELDRCMSPELYGDGIDAIILELSFSFYDNEHCKTNHIIADESLKLKRKDFYPKLREMYTEKEIEDNGYYLRNRFTYGPFRKETGTTRVCIVFEREFSQLSTRQQKQQLSEYLLHATQQVAKRLTGKIKYDFPQMITDFQSILATWLSQDC